MIEVEEHLEDFSTKLPFLEDGESVQMVSVSLENKATKPPKPYTEDTLLGDMAGAARFLEDSELRKVLKQKSVSGIGTAATRADIIEKLKSTKLIETKGKTLRATDKGEKFINWLDVSYPIATDIALTAQWQAKLDEIAVEGDPTAFNLDVCNSVFDLVTRFQAAPAMEAYLTKTTLKGKATMTDTTNKPTDKMMEFAKRISLKTGIDLPADIFTSFDSCKNFIENHKDAAMRPSEKQLKFANNLATEHNTQIPAEALADGRLLSAWIDENLNK